jgi:hypothetical protein
MPVASVMSWAGAAWMKAIELEKIAQMYGFRGTFGR